MLLWLQIDITNPLESSHISEINDIHEMKFSELQSIRQDLLDLEKNGVVIGHLLKGVRDITF